MAYTAKTWVDNSAPSVCAANLNDLETGVADAHTTADRAVGKGVLQAKGDLIAALSASSPTRVVVGADNTVLVADAAETHGLKWVQIGNAQVLAAAAIAYSKLNLASSIVNADVAAGAAIAKSKLAALAISDSDVAAGAAIAYSKLALASSIVNADIASSASITAPKIAGFPSDSAKFLRGDAIWAAAAGVLANVTNTLLAAPAASIDVQNITADEALLLSWDFRQSDVSTWSWWGLRFNADSVSNYEAHRWYRQGAATSFATATGLSSARPGVVEQASMGADLFATGHALIPSYAEANHYKYFESVFSGIDGASDPIIGTARCGWTNTPAAINRLTFIDIDGGNYATESWVGVWRLGS